PRPDFSLLRAEGFEGDEPAMARQAATEAPHLLARASSSSFMWAANAATVAPAPDTADGRLHFAVANLQAMPHRRIEAPTTEAILRRVFPDESRMTIHPAIDGEGLTDEGAANHTRLANGNDPGIHFFVYGARADSEVAPRRYIARQTLAASRRVADVLEIPEARRVFAQQHPDAIDAGVFHNDVIAVGNREVLLHHEMAFLDTDGTLAALDGLMDGGLVSIEVPTGRVSLEEAVRSYLFNSQLISLPDGSMALVCPGECRDSAAVSSYLDDLIADESNPIDAVHVFDLRQSMHNGGGPACLRLRVGLRERDLASVHHACLYTESRYDQLVDWVRRWYPETLTANELADPGLLTSARDALDDLTGILELPGLYDFQH
ncbi:MAG: N-succinylarginine dihydrolase, partial [Phycisphaera sp.]|nr:N-succinylarginine dihydrolase [Phycisphaera sp.]